MIPERASEKAFKGAKGDVVVAETRTQLLGDVRAAEIWLRNRQRKRWAKPEDMPADPEEKRPWPICQTKTLSAAGQRSRRG